MKNIIATIDNYFLGNSVLNKSFVSNKQETALDCPTFKTKRRGLIVCAFLLMFLSLSLTSGEAKAASFFVNLTYDAHDWNIGDGICDADFDVVGVQCTLRAAIEESNALAGIDNITFAVNPANSINVSIDPLSITSNVNIVGPGARLLSVQRTAGAPNFIVFYIQAPNSTVNISGITIANGNSNVGGAGIRKVDGTLNLTDVTVKNNTSTEGGGGITNFGTLNITRSTISNNTAPSGGGINNQSGTVNISNSTISGNTANSSLGGGIINYDTLILTNVTISNNTASGGGGGIYLYENCSLRNTIIAGNTAPGALDVYGVYNSLGNNLIGISNGSVGFTNGVNGDKTGTLAAPLNAQLGALQNNGGQTDTHALLSGSPAIDTGNNCVVNLSCVTPNSLQSLTTDQRGAGFPRQLDGDGNGTATVDIGAFESPTMITTAAGVVIGGQVLTGGADGKIRGIRNVRVTITFPNGETRATLSNAFGYYRFSDIPAGETYVISVSAKRYVFAENTRVINIGEDALDIDFIADAVFSVGN